ncbi:rho GTPase-activating protein REN1-like [Olea europaea var. sylvestris]|uniref:rho GTPase-activating protein REN1-like n=1 Tax=Olea europaea var. sylvestris TaxID=158386 RepID=UPI000C1D413E|nr:rho GTPase-activating protein REN1-like [Olea europaea var. sylvestris]
MYNRDVESSLNPNAVFQGEGDGNVPSPPSVLPGPTVHGGNKKPYSRIDRYLTVVLTVTFNLKSIWIHILNNLVNLGARKVQVYKSGPLFLSSKGIGWTSWKRRWFILTRTSLVFFRCDPTLGGIDLNSSGSVLVKEDKELLTVLFPDGRDGRAFTLKAETLEDLQEWKAALEEALLNAPSAALLMGQNGVIRNNQSNAADTSLEEVKDRQPVKSLVIGRPILLALEDINGTPSLLEKALRFVEAHGVKVEGILRQAADVDDVERRIRDYEQGKNEFTPEEDPHVIADCVKYVIRELPSSPVPASCCIALLEACRTDRGMRVNAMCSAICETFPEPNRRLLQRILMMMQTIASHKAENRMSTSAVAACMAPLLLRPLLAGNCELENVFDMGGDGSVQLLQAAAAANHAQAICITLLEEYDNIFGEGTASPEPYTDSAETGSESEKITDDDDDDVADSSEVDIDVNSVHALSETSSETGETEDNKKVSGGHTSDSSSPEVDDALTDDIMLPSYPIQTSLPQHDSREGSDNIPNQSNDSKIQPDDELLGIDKTSIKSSNGLSWNAQWPTAWGHKPAKKSPSMESIDLPSDDDTEIQKLESTKADFQNRIAKEAKANLLLKDKLEMRMNALHERRNGLLKNIKHGNTDNFLPPTYAVLANVLDENMVAKLLEQLQKERELRAALEAGLRIPQEPLSIPSTIDEKKADDLQVQLNQQQEQNSRFQHDTDNQLQQNPNNKKKSKDKNIDVGDISISSTFEKSARNKAANYTTSALAKLTNRLKFLKEKRAQIANELHNLDKSRSSGHSNDSIHNFEQGEGSDHQHFHQHSVPNAENSQGSEGQSSERHRGSDSSHNQDIQFVQNANRARNAEEHPNLDRGKSESFPTVDKGRSSMRAPRAYSR